MNQKLVIHILHLYTASLLSISYVNAQDHYTAPNIVLILADDMGYGDPECYNRESQIRTPHINQLASEGMLFTDAHTTSSVCTPTRYGIITGRYSWRGPLKKGVTWSYDSLIIEKNRETIATLLKDNGYYTACIGKWHLGLGWQMTGDSVLFEKALTAAPTDLGFDYFYGIAASLDIPPYVFIENNCVVQQPAGFSVGPSKTISDDFWRKGPVSPDFDHYQTLNHLTSKATDLILKQSETDKPFFLYFALTAPHLPWIPTAKFRGQSGAGAYGDISLEVDEVVGRILEAIKISGAEENTLIIFTSDNGSQFSSANMEKFHHNANFNWRGRKGDIYEGGHRVPFIVKWPGKVEKGEVSEQLISTTDFLATFAEIVNAKLDQPNDSKSFLPVLSNQKSDNELRKSMIYHSAHGLFGYRNGPWVYIDGKGSGGFLEVPDTTSVNEKVQLYHLYDDPEQKENISTNEPEKVEVLKNQLNEKKKNEE